ncbi:glycosyltransferase family 4 protein [Candidatus Gottesmanbacteria bacterium]|nr:glycosyltransferase family 4 protein [Candidatus Gottesmanbacteria bacterium]
MRKLRIAQIAPIWNDTPPKHYGGIERVVNSLTEELVRRGHEVTLFATSSSQTSAKLVATVSDPMSGKIPWGNPSYTIFNISEAYKMASSFDIIHSHTDFWCFPFASLVSVPSVHTLHNLLPSDENDHEYQFYARFKDQKLISISNNQRQGLPWNFIDTVYNGIDANKFSFSPTKGTYLFWAGRITNSKGAKDVLLAAKKLQMPLVFAGHLIGGNKEFYETEIVPLLNDKLITVTGDISSSEAIKYYQNAYCTLMPIHWEEPFGLVMTESLSCGTPVVAYRRGSVPELIKDGETGFIVPEEDGIDGLVNAVKKIDQIDRLSCRQSVESKFTIEKMVDHYEEVYGKVIL